MANLAPRLACGSRCLRRWLRPPQLRDLILHPDLDLVAVRCERVPARLGGGRRWTAHEEDGEQGAAGEFQLLFQAKPLEGVEHVVTTVLEVLGEALSDGGQHERLQRRGHDG